MKTLRETFAGSKLVNSSDIVRKPTQPSRHPPLIDAQRRRKKFVYVTRAYQSALRGDWHSARVEIRTYRNHTMHITPDYINTNVTHVVTYGHRLNTRVLAREFEYWASRRVCDVRGTEPSRLDTVIRTSSAGSSIERTTAHD